MKTPVGLQRDSRGPQQRTDELIALYQRLEKRMPRPPVLGGATLAGISAFFTLGTTPIYTVLTYDMSIPFIAVALQVTGRDPGLGTLQAELYSVPRDDIGPGRFTAKRAVGTGAQQLTSSNAMYCIDLDREVLADADRVWIVGLKGSTAGAVSGGESSGVAGNPPTFLGTGTAFPDELRFGDGGNITRHTVSVFARLLHRKGKRLLCD